MLAAKNFKFTGKNSYIFTSDNLFSAKHQEILALTGKIHLVFSSENSAELHKIKNSNIFADGIEILCNGSTTDFGSVCPGSNPGISTKAMTVRESGRFFRIVRISDSR